MGKGLHQTQWGEGETRAGFLEEEKRKDNGCELWGLNGDKGVSAGEEEGTEPLRCQLSPRMQSPGGVWERGLLPAKTAILGPESNQIRRSPQSPQQLRRTAVQAEGAERLGPRFLPPTDLSGLPGGCGLQGKGEEEGKGFGVESETWAKVLCPFFS